MADTFGQDSMTENTKMDTFGAGVWWSWDRARDFPVSKLLHLVEVSLPR